MKISNETKVGVFATVAIVLLVLGYNLLKGNPIFSRETIYYARYDRVDGLVVPNRIRVNGMNVGNVKNLKLIKDSSLNVIVTLAVDPAIKIPKGSIATIQSPDLLGTKIVQIEFSDSKDFYKQGDTLTTKRQAGFRESLEAQIAPIRTKAEQLLGSVDSVLDIVRGVFNEESKSNLRKSIKSIQGTLDNLDQVTSKVNKTVGNNMNRLDQIFANIESISANLNKNSDEITALLTNLSAVSDSIRRSDITATISKAKEVLEQASDVMQKINEGKGSLGLLVNDDQLYHNLDSSARSLDALLIDMKANPNHYVSFSLFGRKNKPAEPTAPK